ncbi:MAG: hypothetical protein AAFX80_15775, partial [Cyanobacteria bacterium J06639_18]
FADALSEPLPMRSRTDLRLSESFNSSDPRHIRLLHKLYSQSQSHKFALTVSDTIADLWVRT